MRYQIALKFGRFPWELEEAPADAYNELIETMALVNKFEATFKE